MAKKPASTSKAAPAAASGEGGLPGVLILTGTERYLMREATEQVRRALVAKFGEVHVATFDGASASPADVLDELRSLGLMTPCKLVIVENAEQLLREKDDEGAPASTRAGGKSARELLEAYVQQPEPSAVLVLRQGAGKWAGGKLERAVVAKFGEHAVLACAEKTPGDALSWLVARARGAHGVPITGPAAQLLVEQIGTDLGRLDGELAKLAVGALARAGKAPAGAPASDAQITPELVAELTGFAREDELWTVQSLLLQADAEKALHEVRRLMTVSRHGPTTMSFAILELARKLDGVARMLASGAPEFAASTQYKLFGASAQPLLRRAARMRPSQTARLLALAAQTDASNKSGVGDQHRNVELLALRFVAAMN
jgi:DNA polymerase-3 subunit delta